MAKKNAIEKAKELFNQFTSGVGNAVQRGQVGQSGVSSNYKPLFQTPLANAKPINWGQVGQTAYKAVAPAAQKVGSYMIDPRNNPLGIGMQLPTPPKLNIPNIPIKNPVGNFVVNNLAAPIAQSIVNTPYNFLSGSNNINQGLRTGQLNPLLKGIGQAGEAGLNLATMGGAGTLAKSVVKPILKVALSEGLKTGAWIGGAYGGANALQGEDHSLQNIIKTVGWSALLGGGVGLAGGALGGAVSKVKSALDRINAKHGGPIVTIGDYVRYKLTGKFAPKPEVPGITKGRPMVINDYKTKLKAVDKDLGIDKLEAPPVGLSIKTLTKEQHLAGQQPVVKGGVKKVTQISTQVKRKLLPSERTAQQLQEVRASAPQTSGAGSISGVPGKPGEIPSVSSKYSYNINKTKLQMTGEQKKTLDTVVNSVKPTLQQAKGKILSNDEVIKAAKSSNMMSQVTSREQTLQAEAAILKARQRVVELNNNIDRLAKEGKIPEMQAQMKDLIDSLRVASSNAADAGRKLQSFNIEATDESIRMAVLKEIGKTNATTDDILRAAEKVDWNNANSITNFYRQFVKPSITSVLDEYRYNNMLSNPKTHLRNAFSNLMQTFVTKPTTILVEGKPVEAAKYLGGAMKSFPDAIKAFTDAFSGKTAIAKPDIARIATNKLPRWMTIPTRAMEAGDKFFSALIKGGEMARGATAEQATARAEYSLFRQGLNPKGQGTILNAIDGLTNWMYQSPKAIRWFVPFIRTPMNFAKQWLEYSPAGFSTAIKSSAPREQIAKAIIGSTVTAFGGMLALEGKTTWSAPTDPKQKDYFYSSGRKPFSILIGDKWVPMQYAGPFAYALALPAAMKFYQEDNRTSLTDSGVDKGVKIASSMAQFFSQQTFLSGLGNFVNWASGSQDVSLGSSLGFTAQQIIPMEALISYINSIIDPIYRKANSFTGSIQKNIPIASQALEPYRDVLTGEPSKRLPENYTLPYDVGKANPRGEELYQLRGEQLQNNAILNKQKKDLEKQLNTSNPLQAHAEEIAPGITFERGQENQDMVTSQKSKLQEALVKQRVEMSGKPELINEKFFYTNDNGSVVSMDLSPIQRPKFTGYEDIDKVLTSKYSSRLTTEINNLAKLAELGQITYQQANELIQPIKAEQERIKLSKPKTYTPKKITARRVSVKKTPVPKPIKLKIKTKKFKIPKYKPLPSINFRSL